MINEISSSISNLFCKNLSSKLEVNRNFNKLQTQIAQAVNLSK